MMLYSSGHAPGRSAHVIPHALPDAARNLPQMPNAPVTEHKGICERCQQPVTSHHRRRKTADGSYEHEVGLDGMCNLAVAMQLIVNHQPNSAPSPPSPNLVSSAKSASTGSRSTGSADTMKAQPPIPPTDERGICCHCLQPVTTSQPRMKYPNGSYAHERDADGTCKTSFSGAAALQPHQAVNQQIQPVSAPLQALPSNVVLRPHSAAPAKNTPSCPLSNRRAEPRGVCPFCQEQVTTEHERVKLSGGSYAHRQCSEAHQGGPPQPVQHGPQAVQLLAQPQIQRPTPQAHLQRAPVAGRDHSFLDQPLAESLNGCAFSPGVIGVRASFLADFIVQCGGSQRLQARTCYDVNEAFIKPMTQVQGGISMTKRLFFSSDPQLREKVGKAKVAVSFCWQFPFLMVVSTVLRHVKQNSDTLGEDPLVWLDLLCANQHETSALPLEWFQMTHPENLKDIGSLIMICSPWHRPTPLTRAWCILEAFACLLHSIPFAFALPSEDEAQLVNATIDDHRQLQNLMTNSLKTIRAATCGKPDENTPIVKQANEITKTKIFDAMEREGYDSEKLALALQELTKDAMMTALRHMAMQEETDRVKRGRLLEALGRMHLEEGMLAAAAHMLELAAQTLSEAAGRHAGPTLSALAALAEAYGKMGRAGEQLALCQEVVAGTAQLYGKFHRQTLASRSEAACAVANAGRLEDALREHEAVLQTRQDFLGSNSEDRLQSMFHVGEVRCKLGEYEGARSMLQECLEQQRQLLGFLHPSTANTLQWLARANKGLGRFPEAEPLECECLNIRIMTLGESHPQTQDVRHAWDITKQQLAVSNPPLVASFGRRTSREEAL